MLRSELEIGQACQAWSAAVWNPAWSRPGTTPVAVSSKLLIRNPSAVLRVQRNLCRDIQPLRFVPAQAQCALGAYA